MKLNNLIKQQNITLSNNWLLDYDAFNNLNTNDEEISDKIYNIFSDYVHENCEVIYYADAIQFLNENDNSLKDSLQLASEVGYNLADINSCTLASLLKADILQYELRDDMTAILTAIELIKESN